MNAEGTAPLGSVFDDFMSNGAFLFNATRLAPSEGEHCRIYYDFVQPTSGALIVDLGSGVGEVGAWFREFDPTLRVVNVVNDQSLILHMLANGRECISCSMDDTPIPAGVADNVMFNESIGHVSLNAAFKEAARLLKDGGVLTIKDFSITNPSVADLHLGSWNYSIRQPGMFITEAYKHGLSLQAMIHPPMFTKHWFDIIEKSNATKQSAMLHDPAKLPLCTALYRFVKGSLDGRSRDCA